jgi:hypothetical protein
MAGLDNPHQAWIGLDFRRNADPPTKPAAHIPVKLFPPSGRRAG